MDTRLRVARAIEKTEEKCALNLIKQVKDYAPEEGSPAIATDGKGAYREAILQTWGKVPDYSGKGRRPTTLQPGEDWRNPTNCQRKEWKQACWCKGEICLW